MSTSVTATATMAAAGMDKRSSTVSSSSSLQTPYSATYPSELRSPMANSPGFLRREDALKTPITPPSAYMDYLKAHQHSPALLSPAPTSTSARFSFDQKPSSFSSETTGEKRSISPPTSQAALSRHSSYDSNASSTSTASDHSKSSVSNIPNSARTRPESPRVTIPPSPFAKPGPISARTPKRLHIPQSPAFSPALPSAHSVGSPYGSTPLSAAPWSASYSPREPGRVSIRQVVTRTVTYCKTPLEPAPKGKRRKIEELVKEESEPPIKQEQKVEELQVAAQTAGPSSEASREPTADATNGA